MKKKPLTITYHNPNSPEESEIIARDFISRAAQEVVKKEILKNEDSKNTTFTSSLTMDEIEENFEGIDVYSGIMQGLNEALEYNKNKRKTNKINCSPCSESSFVCFNGYRSDFSIIGMELYSEQI